MKQPTIRGIFFLNAHYYISPGAVLPLMHVLYREKVEWINMSDLSGDSNGLL